MIQVNALTKAFGATQAVRGVSFEIERGEVVGLLGPNGAGKSTTMRIMTTYIPPDSGDAVIAGYNILEEPLEVRRRIGYLPESSPLYLEMAIEPYLKYVARIRGLSGSQRQARVGEMIEVCGLAEVLDREIGQLSKGYRQRVGLAATLLHDPEFLVFDEPTSGLDPNQIVEIRRLIRRIGEEKTVILSTHILSEVEATCDRVIIIAGGEIVADGSAADLKARHAGEALCTVAVKGDTARAEAAIQNAPFVRSVERAGNEGDSVRFTVGVTGDGGAAEQLFRLAVNEGLVLTELSSRRESLEDVFAQLTMRSDSVGEE